MAQSRKNQPRLTPQQLAAAYAELDLEPGAGLEEVKQAHRRLARALHPDRNPGAAGRLMSRVNRAYQLLLGHLESQTPHRTRRKPAPPDHDGLPVPTAPAQGEGLPLAGCRLKGLVRADGALLYQVEIDGRPESMTLPLRRQRTCRFCDGAGVVISAGRRTRCNHCGGRGRIVCSEKVEVPLPGDWRVGQRIAVAAPEGQAPVIVELNRRTGEREV